MFSNQIPGKQFAETVVKMLEPFSHQVQEKPEAAAHVQAESHALAGSGNDTDGTSLHPQIYSGALPVQTNLQPQSCVRRIASAAASLCVILFSRFSW